MSREYRFIDHTADIAVEVKADTIEELFAASAYAWQETVIDTRGINVSDKREIIINELSYEELLARFLDELNFLFLTKKWMMVNISKIKIRKDDDGISLNAVAAGEVFEAEKHQLKVEIKAITFHQMEIKKINDAYFTRIIFDI